MSRHHFSFDSVFEPCLLKCFLPTVYSLDEGLSQIFGSLPINIENNGFNWYYEFPGFVTFKIFRTRFQTPSFCNFDCCCVYVVVTLLVGIQKNILPRGSHLQNERGVRGNKVRAVPICHIVSSRTFIALGISEGILEGS